MKKLAVAIAVLGTLLSCASAHRYVEIMEPQAVFEGGRPKFMVTLGDELEVVGEQPCNGGRGTCWAVRDTLTGETGFVPAATMKVRHNISASPKPEPADPAVRTQRIQAAADRLVERAKPPLRLGRWNDAIAYLKKADALASGSCVECLLTLSDAYYYAGRFDDVVATAKRLIGLDPPGDVLANAYNQLALGYQGDGKVPPERLAEAEKALRQALSLRGEDDPSLRYNLARLLLRMERGEEARNLLQAILAQTPASAIGVRAQVLLEDPGCLEDACAPDYSVTTPEGPLTRSTLKGKAVLLYFMGPGCENCYYLEELEWLGKRMTAEPLLLVVLVGDAASSETLAELAKHDLGIPLHTDDEGRLSAAFGIGRFPTTVLIDHRARITSVLVGHQVMLPGGSRGDQRMRSRVDAAVSAARKDRARSGS